MDLHLFWAVIRRRKRLAIGGAVLAVILAVFAYGTPGPGGITPRNPTLYQSQTQLLITEAGRNYAVAGPQSTRPTTGSAPIQVGDPNYMSLLSPIYAAIGNGDAVQAAVRDSKLPGTVTATEDVDPLTGAYTPLITLTALAPSPSAAVKLAQRATTAFQTYITNQENQSNAPQDARVLLQLIHTGLPSVAQKPKVTTPVLVLLAVLGAVILLIFSLENKDKRTAAELGYVPELAATSRPANDLLGRLQGRGHRAGDDSAVGLHARK